MYYITKFFLGNKTGITYKNQYLDLSKITSRLFAASYPSLGLLESNYHCNRALLVEYLQIFYNNNYRIYNISGKPFETNEQYPFNPGAEKIYYWEDHHAPPLHEIFELCKDALEYLKQNSNHIIIINCKAGKGRTGVACSCLLLFLLLENFPNANDAIDYFSIKRYYIKGYGVQNPCQRKFVQRFYDIIKGKHILDPNKIFSIKLRVTIFNIEYIKWDVEGEDVEVLSQNASGYKYEINGEFVINLYQQGYLYEYKIAWICLNTFFQEFEEDMGSLTITAKDISPYKLVANPLYSKLIVLVEYQKFINRVKDYSTFINRKKEINDIINNKNQLFAEPLNGLLFKDNDKLDY